MVHLDLLRSVLVLVQQSHCHGVVDLYASEISWTMVDPTGTTLSSGNTQTTDGGATTYSNASYTYAWSSSSDLDDASIASPVASNTTTTTYTLTVTNALGCTGTDDVIATVSNPTAGTLTGTQTIAPGGTDNNFFRRNARW